MVLALSRPMTILLICSERNEGEILKLSLTAVLGAHIRSVAVFDEVKLGFDHYMQHHPDVVLTLGLKSTHSEALSIRIRKVEGERHTGVLVLAPVTENFDRLAEENYFAGADDVAPSNLSTIILKSKIVTVFNLKCATDSLRLAVHKLASVSLTDELTGLLNMRGFLQRFEHAIARSEESALGVVMMDLDHFKKVNDTMNHMVGSHLIKRVGHILAKNQFLGEKDFAARYGGDEFIIVMQGGLLQSQLVKIEGIRQLIENAVFEFQGFKVKITASIGLCWVDQCRFVLPENIVKAADAMLYRSKDLGRNRVAACRLSQGNGFDANQPELLTALPALAKKVA